MGSVAIRPICEVHHRRTRQIRASCRSWRFHLRGGARHGGRDHEAFSRSGGTWTYRGDGIGSGCCQWISEDESNPRFCHWQRASLRASASPVGDGEKCPRGQRNIGGLQSRRVSRLAKQKRRISEKHSKKSLGIGLPLQSRLNGSIAITPIRPLLPMPRRCRFAASKSSTRPPTEAAYSFRAIR
jgi:hypothetical protein